MRLEDLAGQEQLINELCRAVDEDRLPHALFFKGKTGYGPLPLALALSAYVLTPESERQDLGNSRGYKKAVSYLHPDLHFAFPVVKHTAKKRAETISNDFIKEWRNQLALNPYMTIGEWLLAISTTSSSGDINVAECNQIIGNLALKPYESKYKIQIIWMPQYLGNNGNKLLKLIEEPPENSVIIFVGDDTDAVLNTILSRCQIVNVPRIADDALAGMLMAQMQIPEEQAGKAAFMSDGDFNNALSVVSIESAVSPEIFIDWIEVSSSGDALAMRDWVSRFVDLGNEERKGTLLYFLKLMRELVHMKVLGDRLNKLKDEERDLIQKSVTLNKLRIEDIGQITEIVNNAIVMLERNANPRILMFHCSMQIEHIVKTSTLATES